MRDHEDRNRAMIGMVVVGFIAANVLCNSGCPNPYLTGYRTIATTRAAAVGVEQALADVCGLKRVACLETHGPATPAYGECIAPCRKALESWTLYTRPAVNTALVASVGVVATAQAIKGKVSTLDILRPVACALAKGTREWIHLLPPSIKATVDAATALVSGFACPEVK